jgi:hypothetical protein
MLQLLLEHHGIWRSHQTLMKRFGRGSTGFSHGIILYGISWLYCLGDVAYASHKQAQNGVKGTELIRFGVERAVFQAVASMAVSAFLIHSQVKITQRMTARLNVGLRWGPTIAGLAVIPFPPVFLDEPAGKGLNGCSTRFGRVKKRH